MDNSLNWNQLFEEHLRIKIQQIRQILEILQLESLIFDAGTPLRYFEDDQDAPFRTNPHFASLCPAEGPFHLLKVTRSDKPLLIYYSPDDFWEDHKSLPKAHWTDSFQIKEVKELSQRWAQLGSCAHSVFIGSDVRAALAQNVKSNCELTISRLNWFRRVKTEYEISCISKANEIASLAHHAAAECFLRGESEYNIHRRYLSELKQTDQELPYEAIVALNENSAILHYRGRNFEKNGHSFLIDAGATFSGYHSDITRTYIKPSDSHKEYQELLTQMVSAQKELCDGVKPGISYVDLHVEAHKKVYEMLKNFNFIQGLPYEEAFDQGVTQAFFPHGLGHFLGAQVHDVGGKQLDIQGNPIPVTKNGSQFRSLRFVGSLEEGMVLTVEPGFYFIPMLISKLYEKPSLVHHLKKERIEKFVKYGGIRIEDNVVVTHDGHDNLTRKFVKDIPAQ